MPINIVVGSPINIYVQLVEGKRSVPIDIRLNERKRPRKKGNEGNKYAMNTVRINDNMRKSSETLTIQK